jgi:hypothetical protein
VGVANTTSYYYATDNHGEDEYAGICIEVGGKVIEPESVVCMNLETWQRPPGELSYLNETGQQEKIPIKVAVDPRKGRLAFSTGNEPDESKSEEVRVAYSYGFSADLGGGPYERRKTLADESIASWTKTVSKDEAADFKTLDDALTAWSDPTDGNKANAIITILDNATYAEHITIDLPQDGQLTIQSGHGKRPLLRLLDDKGDLADLVVEGNQSDNAALTFSGFLIEGGVSILGNSLGYLNVRHAWVT